MTCTKTFQGAYCLSQIVDNQLITKQYFGYTKKESVTMFREYVREIKKAGKR